MARGDLTRGFEAGSTAAARVGSYIQRGDELDQEMEKWRQDKALRERKLSSDERMHEETLGSEMTKWREQKALKKEELAAEKDWRTKTPEERAKLTAEAEAERARAGYYKSAGEYYGRDRGKRTQVDDLAAEDDAYGTVLRTRMDEQKEATYEYERNPTEQAKTRMNDAKMRVERWKIVGQGLAKQLDKNAKPKTKKIKKTYDPALREWKVEESWEEPVTSDDPAPQGPTRGPVSIAAPGGRTLELGGGGAPSLSSRAGFLEFVSPGAGPAQDEDLEEAEPEEELAY